MKKAEEFYAKKIGKTIAEFDEYDKFVCLVASEFHQSLVKELSEEEIKAILMPLNLLPTNKQTFIRSAIEGNLKKWMKSKLP